MVAQRGLARAARRFAGPTPAEVCATLAGWQERGHRELPWLAGPAFSGLGRLSVPAPSGSDAQLLERFLIGAQSDAAQVEAAIQRCFAAAGDTASAYPPDARGALVTAVERFFDLLAEAYAELSTVVRDGHRRYADQTVDQWRPRLDAAAADIAERVAVLLGQVERPKPPVKRPWGSKDRPWVAFGFVVVALLTAGLVLYMVLHGWPMEPFDFAF